MEEKNMRKALKKAIAKPPDFVYNIALVGILGFLTFDSGEE